MNKVILYGNVGKDPELKFSAQGKACCKFSLATTERWKKDGEKQETTDWHNIVAWGKLAEVIGEYVSKGSKVLVCGKLQTRKYESSDGRTQYFTEVVANEIDFMNKKEGAVKQETETPDSDSEFPF